MIVYDIRDRHIRLRQTTGDQFEFAVVADVEPLALRLSCPPRWAAGSQPADAEVRVYLAHAAARGIAHDTGMIGKL